MASNKVYRIEETETRGKIAVAERDIQAGELVVVEKEPVLYFSDEFKSQHYAGGTELESSLAAFRTFITGPTADNLRKFVRTMQVRCEEDNGKLRFFTDDEVERFVKVAQIARLNMFGTGDGGNAVFEEITRFTHSCLSNCDYSVRGRQIFCFAKRFISAGEELTISYFSNRDLEPTHERRYMYLLTKDFTCHCPRCDAIGDDTRQFDCVDPACKGAMMVCQPINNKISPIPGQVYTGVEYVEPHLLPCTVCHRTSPADYQTDMFALETKMLGLGPRLAQRFNDIMDARQHRAVDDFLKELHAVKIPRRHSAALPFLKTEYHARHSIFLSQGARAASAVGMAASAYIAALENIFPYAHIYLAQEIRTVGLVCSKFVTSSALSMQQEKDLCLKAMRMFLLLLGRNGREAQLDKWGSQCHEKLPSALSTEMCAFCEESPGRAAFTLSRCGRCKQVAYCSVECQRAHWKVHKESCKKVV